MTTEEKLDHFYELSIEEATKQANDTITSYESSLKEEFEQFLCELKEETKQSLLKDKDILLREKNKTISDAYMKAKLHLKEEQEKLEQDLEKKVIHAIHKYKKQEEYKDFLIQKINFATTFAKDNPITIYLDKEDAPLKEELEQATHTTLSISEEALLGGIKAFVPSKHILIDETFASTLQKGQLIREHIGGLITNQQ